MEPKEEKKEKESSVLEDEIIPKLEETGKGFIVILADNISGLAKDNKPDAKIEMRSNLIDPLIAHNLQKVLVQLRQRGA